ncbi:MAG: recombinase family protein [Pirellulales bacterium]|nr:recombinase family protein [Pirellulales bacterium]
MKNVRGAEPTVGLRIGVYIRVSTQRQATEGDSLEAQRSETTKYIEYKKSQQGWEVASIMYYVDAGRSAKDQNRPELQRLKLDTAAGTLDMVVCFKLDRITRSLLDFVELWKLFSDHDVRVISLREDFDTSTVMGEAMVKLIMVFAELARQLTAERTIATMKDRVSRGLWNGGYIYGYLSDPDEPGRLIPDPEWAPIIKAHFFDAFEDFGSAGAVQRHLLKNGIRMPQRESRAGKKKGGKPFDKQQVIRILKNPVYIGQVKWGDEVCENAHEPIISKAQFDRVQRKLRQTIARRRNHKYSRGRCYPLRGLVRCACGAMMTLHGTVGRGKTYHYYKCTKQDHQGGRIACDAPAIPAEALETAVSERVVALGTLERDRECVVREALGEVDDSVRRLDAKAESVRRRLTTVQTELQNLVGVLKQIGGSGLASVQEEMAALEEERSLLRDQLQRLAQQKAPAAEKTIAASKFVESWAGVGDLLRQATPDEQRTIL